MKWTSLITIPPDLFIDCGPGVLNSEAWKIKKIWPNIKIIGFEANINRFNNLKNNNFPGRLFNLAVGEKDCCSKMYLVDGMTVLYPHKNTKSIFKETKVEMRSIDSLNEEFGPFKNTLIWADIEGSELAMLKGSEETINTDAIIGFYLEVWDIRVDKEWPHRKEINEFLSGKGYEEKMVVVGERWLHDVLYLKK